MDKPLFSLGMRRESSYGVMCRDVLFCILALSVFSYVYFGVRPLLLTLTSVATAVICETLCCVLRRRPLSVLDGSAIVTGALCGMMLSPIAPFTLAVVAPAFAVLFAKMPFGGLGRNPFNPAAAGIALVTVLYSSVMFLYPDMDATLPVAWEAADVLTEASPASILLVGGTTGYNWLDFLFGQVPGPIGATPVLVLCACGAYLMIRRSSSALLTLSYLGTCAVFAVLFPRAPGEWYQSVLLELCSGYLLFAGVFLLADPTTTPSHWLARLLFGTLCGVLTMLMRHIGRFEEGAVFAILLCNTLTPFLDMGCWRAMHLLTEWARR